MISVLEFFKRKKVKKTKTSKEKQNNSDKNEKSVECKNSEGQGKRTVKEIICAVEESKSAKFDERKLQAIEAEILTLLKKYQISDKELEYEISSMDAFKLLENFDELVDLVELEQQTKNILDEQKVESKIKKIKSIVTEIKKHKIMTDFDKVLNQVRDYSKVEAGNLSKLLKIKRKRIMEIAEILEKEDLIEIKYPPVGGVLLVNKDSK